MDFDSTLILIHARAACLFMILEILYIFLYFMRFHGSMRFNDVLDFAHCFCFLCSDPQDFFINHRCVQGGGMILKGIESLSSSSSSFSLFFVRVIRESGKLGITNSMRSYIRILRQFFLFLLSRYSLRSFPRFRTSSSLPMFLTQSLFLWKILAIVPRALLSKERINESIDGLRSKNNAHTLACAHTHTHRQI